MQKREEKLSKGTTPQLDIPILHSLKTQVVKAIILMIGTEIVAIFDGKKNQYFHTKEHDLTKQEIEVYQDYVIARYKITKRKFDESSLKRPDIYYYWKTTKRGRVYRPTPQRIGNITSSYILL